MLVINKDNILNFKLHNHLKDVDDIQVNLVSFVEDYLTQFPEEESKIQDYKSDLLVALNEDLERFKRIGYLFKGQRYQQQIYANPTSSYDLVWDVGDLKEIIYEEGIEPQRLSVPQLYRSHISLKQINPNQLPSALENEEPIILAEFPMIAEQLLILDGNHRVSSRYHAGIQEVWGFSLNRNQHKKEKPVLAAGWRIFDLAPIALRHHFSMALPLSHL
jgi:hypothetical protein